MGHSAEPPRLHAIVHMTDVAPGRVAADGSRRFADPVVKPSAATLLAGDATSFAPNTPAGTWPASALPVPFVLALPRSRDVGEAALAELDVALRTWPAVACTAFRARLVGEQGGLVAADDGVNAVLFHDDVWPAELVPGAVAQTVVHVDAGGRYRDADIHLNGKDFRFSLDGAAGTLDLRSVLVHELGHALGLGHSNDARATMFATGSGQRWRSLETDDRDGVCSLYPGTGTAGCEALPCPAPFLCVAGACQRTRERSDVCAPCERGAPGACEAAGDGARCLDLPDGRVCGRECASDATCGAGFHCLPTTEAGDRQCVSDVACANGASPCSSDADCTAGRCRRGACLAPGEPDAGTDASAPDADAGVDGGGSVAPAPGSDGCAVRSRGAGRGATAASSAIAAACGLVVALMLALRARRR